MLLMIYQCLHTCSSKPNIYLWLFSGQIWCGITSIEVSDSTVSPEPPSQWNYIGSVAEWLNSNNQIEMFSVELNLNLKLFQNVYIIYYI